MDLALSGATALFLCDGSWAVVKWAGGLGPSVVHDWTEAIKVLKIPPLVHKSLSYSRKKRSHAQTKLVSHPFSFAYLLSTFHFGLPLPARYQLAAALPCLQLAV